MKSIASTSKTPAKPEGNGIDSVAAQIPQTGVIGKNGVHYPAPAQQKFIDWAGDDFENWTAEYGGNLKSMRDIADELGIDCMSIVAALRRYPLQSTRAREIRAETLHSRNIKAIEAEPLIYIDKEGNQRVDSGMVAHQRMVAQESARLAGILNRQYAEPSKQVDVSLSAPTPLGDFIREIAARGSTLPIMSGRTIEHDDD